MKFVVNVPTKETLRQFTLTDPITNIVVRECIVMSQGENYNRYEMYNNIISMLFFPNRTVHQTDKYTSYEVKNNCTDAEFETTIKNIVKWGFNHYKDKLKQQEYHIDDDILDTIDNVDIFTNHSINIPTVVQIAMDIVRFDMGKSSWMLSDNVEQHNVTKQVKLDGDFIVLRTEQSDVCDGFYNYYICNSSEQFDTTISSLSNYERIDYIYSGVYGEQI